jgi:uncharacterized protein (TIGR03437 family)
VAITSNGLGSSSKATVDVTLIITVDTRPVITSVVNGASFKPAIGPGEWISIIGNNFATAVNQPTTAVLPTTLGGVDVQLLGTGRAYSLLMHYVSPTQINAFVPHDIAPTLYGASSDVMVTTANGTATYPITFQSLAPALFSYGNNMAAAVNLDGSIVGTVAGTKPAAPGSIISVYGTGFGQTTPISANVNGQVTPVPLSGAVEVWIGQNKAELLWAGMVGVGLYQFNVVVPPTIPPGDNYMQVLIWSDLSSPERG